MEVAVLTAKLEANVAGFMANMKSAEAESDRMQKSLNALQAQSYATRNAMRSISIDTSQSVSVRMRAQEMADAIDKVYRSALAADDAIHDLGYTPGEITKFIADSKIIQHELDVTTAKAKEEQRALSQGTTVRALSSAAAQRAANSNAQELQRLRSGVIRGQFEAQPVRQETDLREFVRGLQIPNKDLRQAVQEAGRFRGGGGIFGGGSGRTPPGGRDRFNPNFFTGLLPGGRRAGAGAVTTGIGILAAAGPAGFAATGAAGLGLAAGMTTLLGSAATLKLAFADISAAAFTSQKAFDALTPVQQHFVLTLKSLDMGLSHTLERTAQNALLPPLTQALHTMFAGNLGGTLNTGIGQFGRGLGAGANNVAQIFGSSQFSASLGTVMKADAGYARDLVTGIGRLSDAFVHLLQSAIPLTNWMDRGLLSLSKWADTSVKAAQASGKLATFWNRGRQALVVFGGLLKSAGQLLQAFGQAVGFQNSLGVVRLLSGALNIITGILRQNRDALRAFFTGAIASAKDILVVIKTITKAIAPLLYFVTQLVKAFGGWRVVIDGLIGLFIGKWLYNLAISLLGVTTETEAATAQMALFGDAATVAEGQVFGLRAALLSLGAPEILAALAAVASVVMLIRGGGSDSLPRTTGGIPSSVGGHKTYGKSGDFAIDVGGGRMIEYKNGHWMTYTHHGVMTSAPRQISLAAAASAAGVSASTLMTAANGKIGFGTGAFAGPGAPGSPAAIAAAASSSASRINTFGKPGLIMGTGKSGVLPARLEDQIATAVASGNTSQQIAAINAGISWITSHAGAVKGNPTTHTLYMQELASLKQQKATIQSAGRGGSSGIALLSPGLSAGLSNAQQAVAFASTPAARIRAEQNLLAVQRKAYDELGAKLKDQHLTQKQILAIEKERTSLAREMATANGHISTAQKAIVRAQQLVVTQAIRAQGIKTSGIMGAFTNATVGGGASPQAVINAANTAAVKMIEQQRQITQELKNQNLTETQQNMLKRESLSLSRDIARVEAASAKAQTAQATARAQGKMASILGITGAIPSAARFEERERTVLLNFIKSSSRPYRGRGVTSDPLAAFPNAQNEPIAVLIKQMEKAGLKIPRSSMTSLDKINQVLMLSFKEHAKLNSLIAGNLSDRLAQINQTLQASKSALHATYGVPTINELMRGLKGSPAVRRALAERLIEVEGFGGKIPHGPAALGIPLGPGGRSLITHGGAIHLMPNAIPGASAAFAKHVGLSQLSPESNPVNIHGDVNIYLSGHGSDAATLAKEIRKELTKTARRNATQTRGPNAGRNIGHN